MDFSAFTATVTDHRSATNQKYSLESLLFMIVVATCCGYCEDPEDIKDFVNLKLDWFKRFIPIERAPCRETLRAFISSVNPNELMNCFYRFTQDHCNHSTNDVIAIDGKTMRATHKNGKDALHMVSAWSCKNGITLACLRSKSKKNEVKAMQTIIQLFAGPQTTFTMDAMGCTKGIAKKIFQAEADYVLQLKDNQPYLKEAILQDFDEKEPGNIHIFEERDHLHGRQEYRKYAHFTLSDWIASKFKWEGLFSAVRVYRERNKQGSVSKTVAWYITSFNLLDGERCAKTIRGHWQIENNLHWRLDVILNDDRCRHDKDRAAENISMIRRLALNLYKQDKRKIRLKSKMARAVLDDQYREQVILGFY